MDRDHGYGYMDIIDSTRLPGSMQDICYPIARVYRRIRSGRWVEGLWVS